MKRLYVFPLLLIAMLLCSIATSAHDFEVDGIYYNIIDSDAKAVEVTFDEERNPSHTAISSYVDRIYTIPSIVVFNGNKYDVVRIGYTAFMYGEFESIEIPNSVLEIEELAFCACWNLNSITIPNSVTKIGDYAFGSSEYLTSIKIPSSVISIGKGVFSSCHSLKSIEVDNENKVYDSREDCNAIIETMTNTLVAGCRNTCIPESITIIGNSAFEGVFEDFYENFEQSIYLQSICIPNSVVEIGDYAFASCQNMPSITIPSSVIKIGQGAFQLTYLKSVSIPNSVVEIGDNAFAGNLRLESVNIPSSTIQIGHDAFNRCPLLGSIIVDKQNKVYDSREDCNAIIETATNTLMTGCKTTIIPNSVVAIGKNAFMESEITSIEIPNSVVAIGENAFMESEITSIEIPNSVVAIGERAFWNCKKLEHCQVSETVKTIGWYAFHDTKWYSNKPEGIFYINNVLYEYKGVMPDNTSVIIADGTVSITDFAFYDCIGLKSVSIPNTITEIGISAFYNCINLKEVNIPNSVTKIGGSVFFNCTSLTKVSIGNLLTEITRSSFRGCNSLNEVLIGNNVKSIGKSAFYGCKELVSIAIPNSVTSIGEEAFHGCNGLTEITIGNSVANIGDYAFWDCSYLEFIKVLNPMPPTCSHLVFSEYNSLLEVPEGSLEAYRQAKGWRYFSNITEVSGIEGVKVDATDIQELGRYDIDGRLLTEPTPGINIIKMSDGSTRKEWVK